MPRWLRSARSPLALLQQFFYSPRRYCGRIDVLSQELQACKRQLIIQQKKSERALAEIAASRAEEIAALHQQYATLIKDLEKKMLEMQAQVDAEQSMKRDWTLAQRKVIQSARSHSEKFAALQVNSTQLRYLSALTFCSIPFTSAAQLRMRDAQGCKARRCILRAAAPKQGTGRPHHGPRR